MNSFIRNLKLAVIVVFSIPLVFVLFLSFAPYISGLYVSVLSEMKNAKPEVEEVYVATCPSGRIVLEQYTKHIGCSAVPGLTPVRSCIYHWTNLWFITTDGKRIPFETHSERDINLTPDTRLRMHDFTASFGIPFPSSIPDEYILIVDPTAPRIDPKGNRVINLRISENVASEKQYLEIQDCFRQHSLEIQEASLPGVTSGWYAEQIGVLFYGKYATY